MSYIKLILQFPRNALEVKNVRKHDRTDLMNCVHKSSQEIDFQIPQITVRRDDRWPSGVRCELNVPEWEELMNEYDLMKDWSDVLQSFKEGFDQGIPEHNIQDWPWYTPPNQASAELVRDKIEKMIDREKKEGKLYGPFTHQEVYEHFGFFRSNPMGSVVNNDGSFRMISNLSFPRHDQTVPSVNSFVDKEDFETTWDDFAVVAVFLKNSKNQWELAIFDWEKAYRQIPTHPSQWKYLLILDFHNRLWVDTRVGFGGVAGCGTFGRAADVWKEIMMLALNIPKIFRWVDDNLIIREKGSNVKMEDVLNLSRSMGVKTNHKKYSDFADEQKYLGFIWNGKDKTVRLPVEKIEQQIQNIKDLLSGAKWKKKEVDKFVGRLGHTTYILPDMRCYMKELYGWKEAWRNPEARRGITEAVKEDLEEWLKVLESFEHMRIIPDTKAIDIGWVGDASTSFGVGVLVGQHWAQFKLKPKWNEVGKDMVKRNIAWLETVAVRLGILMNLKLRNVRGKGFIVWTDNTTTEAAMRNSRSKDKAVNTEWKHIQKLLTNHQFTIKQKRVTSGDNDADALSRGIREDKLSWHYEVRIEIPQDLISFIYQI